MAMIFKLLVLHSGLETSENINSVHACRIEMANHLHHLTFSWMGNKTNNFASAFCWCSRGVLILKGEKISLPGRTPGKRPG